MNVKQHYDQHLGNFYSWMTGNFEVAVAQQMEVFRNFQLIPATTGKCLDLGAGHGIQSVALARLGFQVKAIDFNRQLLEELKENA